MEGDEVSSKRAPVSDENGGAKKAKLNDVKVPVINPLLTENLPAISELFQQDDKTFGDVEKHVKEACSVVRSPFKVMSLNDFVDACDDKFLDELKFEVNQLELVEKNNDLYRFRQSHDLKNYETEAIKKLCTFMSQSVLPFIKKLTDIELDETIDITASVYQENDYLLCHDDQLEGRRIAFILYLVPKWTAADGGCLDLFDCDENFQPQNVVESIVPKWNTFLFFEVTPKTFHQVAEVLSDTKTRLSINGWFHGRSVARPSPYIEPTFDLCQASDFPEEKLVSWINPLYLQDETQFQIQEEFGETSEISLKQFFNEDKFNELSRALKDSEAIVWQLKKPPHKRKYEVALIDGAPEIVNEAFKLFQSEAMFLILSNLTGLKLHRLALTDDDDNEDIPDPSSPAKCRGEIRRWTSKSYTLIHDDSNETRDAASLDVCLYFNVDPNFDRENGGYTSYIAKDDDDELLTIEPNDNTINIVYREEGTIRFVKYINSKLEDSFHDINFVYYQ